MAAWARRAKAMARPGKCDHRRLDLLLRNQLPEDGHRELEAHLVACPACRVRLDALAGGGRWWTEVRRYLAGDGASQVMQTTDSLTPPSAGIVLDFLKPSDDSASLGRLGAYDILEVVGRGGMGIVLKAFDLALHRTVAIKVLAPEYAGSGAARKRFAREAQAAAAVSHDHVVPVHAVHADATPPYLVMAFIPGQSLQQRVDESGPLQLKEILRIGMQTAAGLAAAHAQGLVHRDIKPANIMLENGIERVRITDFGLARTVDDASITHSGAVAGTPQYMAPEQAGGEPVDQRADLFALGSTLYFMATGAVPFPGDRGLAVLRQVCEQEPASMRALNPEVPPWLEGIVRRLHAKDPASRFQSAAEVAELLERCLAHVQQPDQKPLPRLAQELARAVRGRVRPRRLPWSVLAAVTLATALTAGVIVYFLPRPGGSERPTNGSTSPGPEAAPSADLAELARLEDPVLAASAQLQTRVNALRESLQTAPPGAQGIENAAIVRARQRADELFRHWNAAMEPDADPVDAELEAIRRRLEQVRRNLRGDGL